MKLSVQEHLIPGETIMEMWDFAQHAGYDAIELHGDGDGVFASRLPEFKAAKKAGVDMPMVCPRMPHFIGDFDAELRADAIKQLKSMLSVMAELEGQGVMTPTSWGMFSKRLPPFVSPRSEEDDRKVLVEGLTELGEHAQREGVQMLLEPLNEYETHMVHKLSDAISIVEEVNLPSVGVVGDTFHMNICEVDPVQAILDAGSWIKHMQTMDTNRYEPGTGHLDFRSYFKALKEIGYDGYLALECRLSEPSEAALPKAARILREAWS